MKKLLFILLAFGLQASAQNMALYKKVIKEKDMITGEVLKKYVSYRCPLMQINEENEEHFIIDEAEHSVMSAEDELIAHMTEKGLFDEINSLPNDYSQTIHLCELQGLRFHRRSCEGSGP